MSLQERTNQALGLSVSELIRVQVNPTPDVPLSAVITIDGQPRTLQMVPHSVRAPNYQLLAQIADGSIVNVEPGPERSLRGVLLEVADSIAAGSLLQDGLHVMIKQPNGITVWMEPLAGRVEGAEADHYVVYHSDDVIHHAGTCGNDAAEANRQPIQIGEGGDEEGGIAGTTLYCVELACDADVEYYIKYGSNIASVQARITSVTNTMNVQYETDVDIRHILTTILVRTAEPDPYSSTAAGTLLGQFRTEWLNNQGAIVRDVAQLFTNKSIDGSTIGIAWDIGVICTTSAYCLVQSDFNNNFSCATDLSAHELGHLWNGSHCTCPTYTMNPSITCTNDFDPVTTIPSIIAHRNTRTCIGPCENGVTTLPFSDQFPSTTIDITKWTGNDGATSNTTGTAEPSAPNSLNLEGSATGGDSLRTAFINTVGFTNLTLQYLYQLRGGGDSPEAGDDLVVDYLNGAVPQQWVEIGRHLGSGADMTTYLPNTIVLPAGAYHPAFRLRFRCISAQVGLDDWFVDNVSITATVPPGNNDCLSATLTLAGSVAFSSVGATTDGPAEPTNCNFGGYTQIGNDVWFRFPAQCTGTATVSLCGAGFDAKLAVYPPGCPSASNTTLACNDSFCGNSPQVTFPSVTGTTYRIRIGGFNGATGSGTMVITCTPSAPPCPADIALPHNGAVNVDDLLAVINSWGVCVGCAADIAPPPNGDDTVNVDDLLAVINAWGPCP